MQLKIILIAMYKALAGRMPLFDLPDPVAGTLLQHPPEIQAEQRPLGE